MCVKKMWTSKGLGVKWNPKLKIFDLQIQMCKNHKGTSTFYRGALNTH